MSVAMYAGSFDPVTMGHLDVINRAALLFDELYVAILKNSSKQPMFTIDERVEMMREETADKPNVKVVSFDGLVVDAARACGADVLVRGLRAVSDFEYELQMAQLNHSISDNMDTVFFATELEYAFLSSSVVKEVAFYHGDISAFVTPGVERRIREKFDGPEA